jgi:hypothetical protein
VMRGTVEKPHHHRLAFRSPSLVQPSVAAEIVTSHVREKQC